MKRLPQRASAKYTPRAMLLPSYPNRKTSKTMALVRLTSGRRASAREVLSAWPMLLAGKYGRRTCQPTSRSRKCSGSMIFPYF